MNSYAFLLGAGKVARYKKDQSKKSCDTFPENHERLRKF
jgi:hypothetical protein